MPHQIIGVNECRLCRKRFTGELGILVQSGVARVGTVDDARLQSQITRLTEHIREKHPEHANVIDLYTEAYRGFLFLSNFSTTDPRIRKAHDEMRWQLHTQTANATIPDEKLEAKTLELAEALAVKVCQPYDGSPMNRGTAAEILYEGLLPILKGFRDQLQEPGKYPPIVAESTPEKASA